MIFHTNFSKFSKTSKNHREQLPFISEENNYSKRSHGLFRCKSILIMNSFQHFFQILSLGSFPEGGCPPPTDQMRGIKGPTKIGLTNKLSYHATGENLAIFALNKSKLTLSPMGSNPTDLLRRGGGHIVT